LKCLFNSSYHDEFKKVYITASGGPFFNNKYNEIKNISFKQAKKHPKWKMGNKNSIDSATLANKCLELIEAHYLFNLPYDKLGMLIHPEALVHSIIEYNNYTSVMNYFYHDMFIPLFNFFSETINEKNYPILNCNYDFKKNSGWIHASQLKKGKSFILLKDQILFSNPTKYSKPLLKIAKGRLLLVKKCKKNWCRVKTGNFLGWIKTNEIWGLY